MRSWLNGTDENGNKRDILNSRNEEGNPNGVMEERKLFGNMSDIQGDYMENQTGEGLSNPSDYQPIMDQSGEKRDKEYQNLVKELTPTASLIKQMFHAFWTGGLVCVIGQFIINMAMRMGADDKTAGSWCSFLLILISVLLTGFNLFGMIAKYAGAGILVPITGFANGIASSAIEFQKEGQVFGIGCKIFTIAGPVILYGLVSSWLLGLIYWILKMLNVM